MPTLKALWLKIWCRRTTVTGYVGIALGVIQANQGGSFKTLGLAVAIALIGHYNAAKAPTPTL